ASTFPSRPESRRLALGVFWRMPLRNTWFLAFLGLFQTLSMLAFANTFERQPGIEQRLVTIPAVLMAVIDILSLLFLAMPRSAGHRLPNLWILALSQGVAFVALAVLSSWLWVTLPFVRWEWPLPLLAAVVLDLPVFAFLAGELFALYLLVASRFRVNVNESFAGQGITGYKNFLRLHFADDGSLTIYPIGVARTASQWRGAPPPPAHPPWFAPGQP